MQQFTVEYKYLHGQEYAMLWSEEKSFEMKNGKVKKERTNKYVK